MTKPAALSGQIFHRLTVIDRAANHPGGRTQWNCVCECGNTTVAIGAELKNGHTKSCGCLRNDTVAEMGRTLNKKHGRFGTAEYRVWSGINTRCRNVKDSHYPDYGGRGIDICERWRKFENFFEDMGLRPGPEYSIDRKDNEKGYEPGNCKWATPKEQANNRRSRKPTSKSTNSERISHVS